VFALFAVLAGALSAARTDPADEEAVQRLVSAAREGDRSAARELYSLHVARVYRVVRSMVPGDADAEDIVQDTFLKALGALDRYTRRPGTRFISWLLAIAVNTVRKRAAKLGRIDAMDAEALEARADEALDSDPLGAGLDQARLRERLLLLLAELPDRDRWSLTLRYGGGLSAAEVAAICGLSEANVRKICERQRRRLLSRLEPGTASASTRSAS
jgi:RNA polymerase sigma-70 factor (ECF subfamily)